MENVAEIFVLLLCGVQLVLRSTILDFDEMDVTLRFAEVLRSVLSGVGGSAGGWRCCWGAPSLPQLPPATPKNPPPCSSLLFSCFCRDWSNQHKIWAAGGKSVFIWEAGWEEPLNYTFKLASCSISSDLPYFCKVKPIRLLCQSFSTNLQSLQTKPSVITCDC